MPEQTLKNSIISWLRGFPYWMQYAGNEILEGGELSDEKLETTFRLFLQDADLTDPVGERDAIIFAEESEEIDHSESFKIKEIKGITHVNALLADQLISISDQLTIVYGGNGTGKSGYTRMLNNAFKGRGDKEILSNVFERAPNLIPSCVFTFQGADGPFELRFPNDKGHDAFTRFAIFDTQCIKVHLEQENGLLITPSGFDFFNKLITLYQHLEQKLNAAIQTKRGRNDFSQLFQHPNVIQELVHALSERTNLEQLKELADYSAENAKQVEELMRKKGELLALNIPQRIREYQALLNAVDILKQSLAAYIDIFSEESITAIRRTIISFKHFSSLSKQQGIDSLKDYSIAEIGSDTWLAFLNAARKYAERIGVAINGEEKMENCLFCLQPLTAKEENLVNAYWQFLQSDAQKQAATLEQQLLRDRKRVNDLRPVVFDETTALYQYMTVGHEKLNQTWKSLVESLETKKHNLLNSIDDLNEEHEVQQINNTTEEFAVVSGDIQAAIDALSVKNPAAEIEQIDRELQFLADKNLLHKLHDQIVMFVNNQAWAAEAGRKLGSFRTHGITTKQGELFSQHITTRYTNIFNEECLKLKAPTSVVISQRNAKGQTLRRLQVANNIASKILSEGEQRAITLADFLTEMQLNPRNRGIIFDDPVTSLDHQRRDLIAKRLVEEAKNRQVIVFTHDIALLLQLQHYAEQIDGLSVSVTSMRKQGDKVGVIHPTLPWVAQKITARIGYLKNALVKLEKVEREQTEDEYIREAKSWYGMLREAWERAVEERLFKGVIERFGYSVQTNRLKNLAITRQMLDDIDKGMTESSKWVHDAAAGLNPTIPDSNKAKVDLAFFEAFAQSCPAA